ncbi:MAG TPA: hypothetical protein VN622_05835 [Clostridia bacterium]|nr:hypothetical protein [Clostridia bacterium]
MNGPIRAIDNHVNLLWERIRQMEGECPFNGKPYPEGMAPFPGKLTGQGFFPGGDGLWRDDTELTAPSKSPMPIGGIMFLGNDFGTLQSYETTLTRGYENPPTWRNLKQRLAKTDIPGNVGFYTNAILGLRTTNKALDSMNWNGHRAFAAFCREFLEFRIETMKPRLIVVLGPKPKDAVCADLPQPIIPSLAKWTARDLNAMSEDEAVQQGNWRGLRLTFMLTSHPYSDLGKTEAGKAEDARRLAKAWRVAQG